MEEWGINGILDFYDRALTEALFCPCNIAACSHRQLILLPACGGSKFCWCFSFSHRASAERGADIQRRERRERGAKETAFLSQIGTDEMEGWKKKERMGKVKKAKTPLGDVSYGHGGFFLEYLMTREPRRE